MDHSDNTSLGSNFLAGNLSFFFQIKRFIESEVSGLIKNLFDNHYRSKVITVSVLEQFLFLESTGALHTIAHVDDPTVKLVLNQSSGHTVTYLSQFSQFFRY